jgi:hypothetical protein
MGGSVFTFRLRRKGQEKAMENKDTRIKQLNGFLRSELSAVETYHHVRGRLKDPVVLQALDDNALSHQNRVELLRREIAVLGGDPADSSGLWGGLTSLVGGGAAILGQKVALTALDQGEERGLNAYREKAQFDPAVRSFVETELLPRQEETRSRLVTLKRDRAA